MADDVPRPLTTAERALLDFMISLVPSGQADLEAQAATAMVIGACTCGCGTYDLDVDRSLPSAQGLATPAAEAAGRGDDHMLDVLLFANEGRLSCVEVVRYGDAEPGKRLPRPSELVDTGIGAPPRGRRHPGHDWPPDVTGSDTRNRK